MIRNEKKSANPLSVYPVPASGCRSCSTGGRDDAFKKLPLTKHPSISFRDLQGESNADGYSGNAVLRQAGSALPRESAKGNSSKRQIAIYSKVTLLSAPCDSRPSRLSVEFGGEKGLRAEPREGVCMGMERDDGR